jgi:glycosyl transferase family 25
MFERSMPRLGVFVINLDRRSDRLEQIDRRLSRLGLGRQRIRALDERSLGSPPWPGFDHVGYRRRCGKCADPHEYACYMSHLAALEAVAASGVDIGLVLEDDADFAPGVRGLIEAALAAQDEWDVLQLGGRPWGAPIALRRLAGDYLLCAMRVRRPGAFAYLVTREAAVRYREGLLPMSAPIDVAFDQSWRLGLRFRAVKPAAAFPAGAEPSTVEQAPGRAALRKLPWWRRASGLVARVSNEARRIGYHLSRGVFFPAAKAKDAGRAAALESAGRHGRREAG